MITILVGGGGWGGRGLAAVGALLAGPARLADHQLGLEDDLAVLVRRLRKRLVQQELRSAPAEQVAWLTDRGKRHRRGRREVDVVVADDGDAVGDLDPADRHLLENA